MKLHLLRHTRPDIPEGVCYGQSDVPLAKTFPYELKDIQKNLKDIRYDIIYSSPLSRCSTLAENLINNKLEIQYDSKLKELNFGEWELKAWDEIEKNPYAKQWFKEYIHIACPGGESYTDLLQRIIQFINVIKSSESKDILCVTHAGVIRAIHSVVKGMSIDDSFNLNISYGELITINL